MTTIDPNRDVLTLINVYEVDPERCDELVGVLVGATVETFSTLDGFVSANIHRSHDSTRVVNYAQWDSRSAFEAVRDHPDVQPHLQKIADVVNSVNPILAPVVHSTAR
jgi:hypothetical protein